MIVNENIIKNALNESIDEFLLEEGIIDEINWGGGIKGVKDWWNNSTNGQKVKNGLSNVWNGIKNGVAMYMDYRTNGQWNRKYGINAKGNGIAIGSYYLKKWFKKHYNRLYDIIWGEYYGNKKYFYTNLNGRAVSFTHDWKNNQYTLLDRNREITYSLQINEYGVPSLLKVFDVNGNEIARSTNIEQVGNNNNSYYLNCKDNKRYSLTISVGEDNSTPESYIAQNCRPENFIEETQNGLGDGNFKNAVIAYLKSIQEENNTRMKNIEENPKSRYKINYSNVLKSFSVNSFYDWWQKNANNINSKQEEQPGQQQNKEQENNQNPNWFQQQGNSQQNNNRDQYYSQAQSPFNSDLGHSGTNNAQQISGKKDPNWQSNNSNNVPLFATKK